ncbi:MAG: sigma-70 family RNA polymerase sigma factor [Christensenellaceae bacterium]|nr:sigma-70 family RNA polymerase sigma factor [Christensenellaceae bacterium]
MTDTERSAALEHLMQAYGSGIKRFCTLQLKDPFQAEDAAQDTFVKAWKALDTFRKEGSEKAWLIRIAVNVCRDYQRTGWFRHTERRVTPDSLPEQGQDAHFPDGEVSRAVGALPQKLRMTVLLRYYEAMTIGETADALGVSHATAKRQLKKANEILRRKLEGWYYDD